MSTLDYASRGNGVGRRRSLAGLWLALDVTAAALVVSQWSFLLAMMALNIRESNVPPYGGGSSYHSRALGNADFVVEHPDLAARIARLPRGLLELIGGPALVLNLLTVTVAAYALTAYLAWRSFAARRFRRIAMIVLSAPAIAALPNIGPAIVVFLD